jgi:hypothetical protein
MGETLLITMALILVVIFIYHWQYPEWIIGINNEDMKLASQKREYKLELFKGAHVGHQYYIHIGVGKYVYRVLADTGSDRMVIRDFEPREMDTANNTHKNKFLVYGVSVNEKQCKKLSPLSSQYHECGQVDKWILKYHGYNLNVYNLISGGLINIAGLQEGEGSLINWNYHNNFTMDLNKNIMTVNDDDSNGYKLYPLIKISSHYMIKGAKLNIDGKDINFNHEIIIDTGTPGGIFPTKYQSGDYFELKFGDMSLHSNNNDLIFSDALEGKILIGNLMLKDTKTLYTKNNFGIKHS